MRYVITYLKMIEVDKNKLEELVRDNEKVFVYFYSEWHDYAKMMLTTLEKLSGDIDIPIAICNIDYNYNLGKEHKVRGLPTFSLIKEGEIVKNDSLVRSYDWIRNYIVG